MKKITWCVLLMAGATWGRPAQAQTFDEADLRRHVGYLAADKLEGRGPGYRGDELAARYLQRYFKKLKLQPKGDNGGWYQTFTVRNSPRHGGQTVDTTTRRTQNVVAYLDNGATRTVVIGAHYDHVGLGRDGNSLETKPEGVIHNGADDNASGVAGVLALAKYFTQNQVKEQSNFLFICFSGEELGLLGSKYYTEHPTVDLTTVNYMVNMDMIGRLTEKVLVGGIGTSPGLPAVVQAQAAPLQIGTDSSGVGASDHTSFYLKNLPVLFFFTGAHADYHKAADDVDKINFAGQASVLAYIARIVNALDGQPKLVFTPTRQQQSASVRMKVTMGVMPSYAADGAGLKIDAVTDGRPAQKAGLRAGDVIQAIGPHAVTDVQTYMQALNNFEKGQTTQVKVKRGEEVLLLDLQF
jgi:hypothetical protein